MYSRPRNALDWVHLQKWNLGLKIAIGFLRPGKTATLDELDTVDIR